MTDVIKTNIKEIENEKREYDVIVRCFVTYNENTVELICRWSDMEKISKMFPEACVSCTGI